MGHLDEVTGTLTAADQLHHGKISKFGFLFQYFQFLPIPTSVQLTDFVYVSLKGDFAQCFDQFKCLGFFIFRSLAFVQPSVCAS